ncbi:hypothetical protein GCM10022423_29530 [Flavobacterium ginsengiterrae]|uniref:Uncharacterized protein n=1 Tax=Flavobacterium ginsengiterrae TaxID=871695 RepID=A0ABP7GRB0_9FLAO
MAYDTQNPHRKAIDCAQRFPSSDKTRSLHLGGEKYLPEMGRALTLQILLLAVHPRVENLLSKHLRKVYRLSCLRGQAEDDAL